MKELNSLPSYMKILYNKIYENKVMCGLLDDNRVVSLCKFGLNRKIISDLLRDISKNAHVLQIGLTFGDELNCVYEKIKKHGKLDVFDVSETQLKIAKEKYGRTNIEFSNYNAALPWDEKYDVVICYNLLQELPLKTRQQVMDNVLSSLTTGGKAVFIGYAKPEWWQIIKWPLFLFNRLYKPFAESLWQQPLESFCLKKDGYRWHHTYYGGKLWQKTIAVPKILSNEDVRKLTRLFNGK